VNHARLWFLAGVKNVVVPQELMPQLQHDPGIAANVDHADGYTLIQTDGNVPSHALVQMRDYLAKATLVPHAEVLKTDEAVLKRLVDPAWNPRDSLLLKEPASVLSSLSSHEDGLIKADGVELKTYTPQKIEMEVQATKGGYVLINDRYDSDWEVQVNGEPASLLRADYILRAVAVPVGASTITMRYVAHYHLAGLSLPAMAVNLFSDGAMIAAWVIAGVALGWRRFAGKAAV